MSIRVQVSIHCAVVRSANQNLGVYASVEQAGAVRVGDEVAVL